MFKLNTKYLLCAIIIFFVEVLIAIYVHDDFIRPTFGDLLVVILMYCGFMAFIRANYRFMAVSVLMIAYLIELSQYFHLIVHMGMQHSTLARCILGSSFSWEDMLAYTVGVALVWVVEGWRKRSEPRSL